ncbi:hypothetical protein K402DRAFT_389750 [Aulographum hederae CBS 113979]|uniref:Uncharacterized protein n=1 Tax=Aulographum hederae CBS 113979 TaxID=1176131 RepID=A0A6G1HCV4_9PEZI|nr:hypothetical protein K402DRAFT_389750 [Aulographum hederae CBS 113979]
MNSNSLAALRKSAGPELAQLAERHIEHDLQPTDREALNAAASKFSTHATIGSAIGLGLGVFLAFRVRRARMMTFNAVKAADKPTHVQFKDGRTEPIPDLTPLLRPSALGDAAAYFFFSAGGLFIGGETGLLTGSISAGRTLSRDRESRERIETAFRKFRADVLRREADALDRGRGEMWSGF